MLKRTMCEEQELPIGEMPPPVVENDEPLPEEFDCPWLTKNRLFNEIKSWDAVCPMQENDGLHLVAQEMESADFVPKNSTKQIVRFDEHEQFVVWEAFCPKWKIPDASAAHRFAANWMTHHPEDAVIVGEKTRRIIWRRSFRTEWVEDDDSLATLSHFYIHHAMKDCIECLNAAQLALGGF